MPTSCFTRLIGVPERSYRRWQQPQRQGRPVKGPWPAPAQDRIEPVAVEYADRFPAWAYRKVAMLMRVDGYHAPDSTVLRALKRTGRVLPVGLPGRAAAACRGPTSGVRGGADWPESSLAARLHGVRDPPHEGIGMHRPLEVHLEAINDNQTIKSNEPETLPTP